MNVTIPVLASPADFDEPTTSPTRSCGVSAPIGASGPDDYYPSTWHENIPLNEQFANQIGFDEAVERWEVFGLARSVAHHAYANGAGTISFRFDVPDFDVRTFPADPARRLHPDRRRFGDRRHHPPRHLGGGELGRPERQAWHNAIAAVG